MKTLKSSEISNYLFCPVSWWIGKTKGLKITRPMSEGERYHKLVSENQPKARFLRVCIILFVIMIIAFIIYRFLG